MFWVVDAPITYKTPAQSDLILDSLDHQTRLGRRTAAGRMAGEAAGPSGTWRLMEVVNMKTGGLRNRHVNYPNRHMKNGIEV